MATERRRQLLLAALAIALVGLLVQQFWLAAPTSSAAPGTSNPSGAAAAPARRPPATSTAPGTTAAPAAPKATDVHLDALNAERPKPEGAERDLFRFKPKAPPPPPPAPPRVEQPAVPVVPAGPPPPPPVPPITLKFIGVVESHGEKIAVLSDGRNAPFSGKEGAIIEGRYRILKIGVESVELAYADGRGRQTIRLTGS
jgi:hypothetical protein